MSISTWVYDPYKLAGQHRTLEGRVAVDAMVRANKLTAKEQGEFTYQVAFALDVDNVCIISGELHGEVTLCCQRCLQLFAYAVECTFAVSPVQSYAAAEELSATYEAVIMLDGKIDLLELLEDELILALPQVPMHKPEECAAAQELAHNVRELNQPFQVLQMLQLKNKGSIAED